MPEVIIDGELYVKATESLAPEDADVFQALMDQWWGGGQAWDGEYGDAVRIVVTDEPEARGWTFEELAEQVAFLRAKQDGKS